MHIYNTIRGGVSMGTIGSFPARPANTFCAYQPTDYSAVRRTWPALGLIEIIDVF